MDRLGSQQMFDLNLVECGTAREAVEQLRRLSSARLMSGGTDLLPLLKERIVVAENVIALSNVGSARQIVEGPEGLSIGALVTLAEVAASSAVRASYRALAQACSVVASPQLRNMGTLGGNLMQQTRCWYYRGPANCWLKGGDECFARHGENELHSVFMTSKSPCVSAHPSDPAAALLVFGATIRYETGDDSAEMPVEELYRLPDEHDLGFWTLPSGAVITGIFLPPVPPGIKSLYNKQMARASWSFALAGLAVSVAAGSSKVAPIARVALTGVAPIPFRAHTAESYLERIEPGKWDAGELGSLLVADAVPLSGNAYKVRLLRGMVVESLDELIALD